MTITLQLIIAAGILLVALAYIQGWRRWQHYRLSQSGSLSAEQMALYQRRMRRALIAFFAGLTLLSLVLLSPLYTYSTRYFSMRVAQHLLLIAYGLNGPVGTQKGPHVVAAQPSLIRSGRRVAAVHGCADARVSKQSTRHASSSCIWSSRSSSTCSC